MFKKKDNSTKNSGKTIKAQASNMQLLVDQMQKNADQVEKDILRSEELLAVDAENDKKEQPFQHQPEISERLGKAEKLIKDLFLDIDRAKKLKNPQAKEIENDVIVLHERWLKDCLFYRDIYEQLDDVSRMPRIDWEPVFNEKQKAVNVEEFGPSMAELNKQIAAHNILHKEVEAYSSQLCVASAGSKEKYTELKKQYSNLLDNSKWRRHYLNSLYEYMQGCNKELAFLGEEQDKIKNQDWSDRMVDPPDVRRQYENFKSNNLLSHESEVNKLQDEGDRLIDMKHPASSMIQTQRDALRTEWQQFLNLCICQETHLENVEEYKRYQMDTEQLSETLTKLNNSLDPKVISKQSNSETQMQLEAEEKAVQNSEQLLADLRRRSTKIVPLKLRRITSKRPITLESLCDWETDKDSLSRGDKVALKSNSDTANWDVVATDGVTKTFPGVSFQIPPPDPEAIDKVDLLGGELADIKKRRSALAASLKSKKSVSRTLQSAPPSTAPLDPKVTALAQKLDKLDNDLASTEEGMLSRLRTPVSRRDPAGDLATKINDQEQVAKALKDLEQQRQLAKADLQPLLSKDPSASSYLPTMLNDAENKYNDIAALADLYDKKANASLNLEKQIKKVDRLVSGFERNLSDDNPIPDVPNAIQARNDNIKSQQKDVLAAQDDMKKLSQDLETTEQLCSSLQQGYQEYCPDIQRQRTDVKQLQTRYANVANQLKDRGNILQEAANKNQEFEITSKSLNTFLDNLPKNGINPNEDLSQVNAKHNSQERVVEDLKRKGDDIARVTDLSRDLQNLLSDYESNVDNFNSSMENSGAIIAKKPLMPTLSDAVQKEEKDLINRYAETTAENAQRQKQLSFARNLISQNDEKVTMVEQQQVQLQSQQRNVLELEKLTKELDEEKERTIHLKTSLKTYQERMMSLKFRRGVERVEEKEVLQYYRDPKVESVLSDLKNTLQNQSLKLSSTQTEVEVLNKKIFILEETVKSAPAKLVTREITEFEMDSNLDDEAAKMREEISRMKDEIRVRDGEQINMKTEVMILQQKKPPIKERVVKKEVVKVEKDPEMMRAVKTFETEISDENKKIRLIHESIFQTRSQINALERVIPNILPKVITKEVKKIEQDPDLINESKKIRTNLEEETFQNNSLAKEVIELQNRYTEVQTLRPKVEIKEIVNEIYQIDPNTEVDIMRLKKDTHDTNKKRSELENELIEVTAEVAILRAQKPKVETKEVLQEVVKEERSPENEREIQRLSSQVTQLNSNYQSLLNQVDIFRRERNNWKDEKSKVETKLVTREVIKYEPDPLQEKEADRLRKDLREEAQVRRTTEEMVFDLQNKYIQLQRQKPEEKLVVQEVVRLQRDPRQMMDHDRLGRDLDEQVKSRRQQELELQQLRTKIEEMIRILRESDERQKRIQADSELKEIKMRIMRLEHAPPPVEESIIVEEVLKVERDPKLDRMTNEIRSDIDKETSDMLRIQRDIKTLILKLEILQKEKSIERTVYKEVVRVEKDQAVEAERDRLREQVSQNKFARQDLEDDISRLNDKINCMMGNKSSSSREETTLTLNRDALQREKDILTREYRTLDAKKHDTSLSFQQQSKLISERTHMGKQKSLKLSSDIQRLEREILDEKDDIHLRDSTIRDLLMSLQKEENAERKTKETNVSTKITILDPDTGKDMSPYDAYMQGLIDRSQYINLQELECDWEEITSMGPDGETSVLQDRKSGKQYSIKEALKTGRLTEFHQQQYKQGKIPISEFALLVAGENKKQPQINAIIPPNISTTKEVHPVAGIMDTQTETCYPIHTATLRKLIDPSTAKKLLEAQAATGGIIDINNNERCSVHKAMRRGLVEDSQVQRLLNAEKAFAGVEDPVTSECLSLGEAVQKGWIPKDTAIRHMEAQYLTGGLVKPSTGGRVSIMDAMGSKMIDSTMMRELQSESNYIKDIVDPITGEKINYKQALDRCKKDPSSGLPMLPASSKESGYTSATNRYARF